MTTPPFYIVIASAERHGIDPADNLHAVRHRVGEAFVEAEPPDRPESRVLVVGPARGWATTGNPLRSDRYCISSDPLHEAPPEPETPLYPYGDTLADSDGYLYDTNGAAVIIDGRHATIKAVEAEADHWATHEFRRRQQVAPAQNGLRGPASASPEMTSALPTTSGSQEVDYLEGFQEPIGSVSVGTSRVL